MRTGKARNNSGDDWKTPDWFYNQLDNIYHNETGYCESNINKCCNGKIKSYKGYIWTYA